MKFNQLGQVSLVSAAALILASAFTACSPVTIDYVFIAGQNNTDSANPVDGKIQVFEADRVSGALNLVKQTVSSGGIKPVSAAVSVDGKNLYVANQGDNTLVQFTIGGSGALTVANTTKLSSEGTVPVAISMNGAGTLLYVANLYQPGCSAINPCGGSLAVFPVGTGGALGSPVSNGTLSYWPVGVNPTAVNALPNNTAAYVSTYDPNAGIGYIYGFEAASSGALTAVSGSPFLAGVKPVGLASTATSRFLYATDFSQNELIAYTILTSGILHPLINGPFKTGNQPSAITIDPRGIYIYVANELDNTVSAYEIDLATGTPTATVNTTGSANNSTGTEPVAILVDPGFGRYVYTANFLDNSSNGFLINASTGTLTASQNGPYPTISQPAAIAAVPRGNHSIQINQP
jgi:6-phosphogluconolactonase (cycloisomerase 2 family)